MRRVALLRPIVSIGAVVMLATACATSQPSRSRVTIPNPGDCAPIDVAVAPEIAPAIRTVAQRFNASDAARPPSGPCSFVRTFTIESATVARHLLTGWPAPQLDGPLPTVWIPASSAWPTLVNERSRERGRAEVATIGPSLARSRLVVAMPRPMAKALRAPVAWSGLATLARRGWAGYGHREWGQFRLGKASPELSTDALLATLLVDHDLGTARTLEASVPAYGSTVRGFFENWMQADTARGGLRNMASVASAVVTDERALEAYNRGSTKGSLPVRSGAEQPPITLVSATRIESGLAADYPFVLLRSPNAALRAFERYVQTPAARAVYTAAGFKRSSPAVRPPATVAAPLDRWTSYRKPGRVLVLFDVSDSMRDASGPAANDRPKLAVAKAALLDALARLGPRDEIGLRIFTTKLQKGPSTYWQDLVPIGPFSANRRRLVREIKHLRARQGSPLYTATRDAYNTMHRSLVPSDINGVVLLTDGYNEVEQNNDRDALLKHLAVDRRVSIYTIALGGDADVSTLKLIAKATNGVAYNATSPVNIGTAFADALSNF